MLKDAIPSADVRFIITKPQVPALEALLFL